MPGCRSTAGRPARRRSVGVGSASAGGGPGRACAFMRAAASARVAGGGGVEVPGAAENRGWAPRRPASLLPVRAPMPGAATTSTSSFFSICTSASMGAASVARNHGWRGAGATGVGDGIE
ncbi:hypothetical protein PVAP13_4NG200611 [Panicum virgatum]|uniref:Uncharacterized protein n=1 Tax=Panicum virgatum TaxID=38727 RepID=A0A8T0T5Z2_PANVG|nr:hypothetical protein PVAP13_4NG200611 [Panicum virgatum]